jgi:hypothetical protein
MEDENAARRCSASVSNHSSPPRIRSPSLGSLAELQAFEARLEADALQQNGRPANGRTGRRLDACLAAGPFFITCDPFAMMLTFVIIETAAAEHAQFGARTGVMCCRCPRDRVRPALCQRSAGLAGRGERRLHLTLVLTMPCCSNTRR